VGKKINFKLATNEKGFVQVWEIEKQNLNYAEKFI